MTRHVNAIRRSLLAAKTKRLTEKASSMVTRISRLASTRPTAARLHDPIIVPNPGAAAINPNPDAQLRKLSFQKTGTRLTNDRPNQLKMEEPRKVLLNSFAY